MASGAKLRNDVMDIFNKMKVVKNEDDEKARIRLVCLQVQDDVNVEELFTQDDVDKMEGKDVFQFLTGMLKGKLSKSCRYFLYDCHYDTVEAANKQELVFILWAPPDARIKDKMNYACSKRCLNKIMDGVKHNFEVNDLADFSKDCFLKDLGKHICSLEGHACGDHHGGDHHHGGGHHGGGHHGGGHHGGDHHGGGHHGGDRYGDHQGDHYGDHRGGDRYGDHQGDHYGDHHGDHYGDHRGGDRYGDHHGDHYGDHRNNRHGDHHDDHCGDHRDHRDDHHDHHDDHAAAAKGSK